MKTAIKLCEYDDILHARSIYSLLCLTALKNKFYGICSKAFVKVSQLVIVCLVTKENFNFLCLCLETILLQLVHI